MWRRGGNQTWHTALDNPSDKFKRLAKTLTKIKQHKPGCVLYDTRPGYSKVSACRNTALINKVEEGHISQRQHTTEGQRCFSKFTRKQESVKQFGIWFHFKLKTKNIVTIVTCTTIRQRWFISCNGVRIYFSHIFPSWYHVTLRLKAMWQTLDLLPNCSDCMSLEELPLSPQLTSPSLSLILSIKCICFVFHQMYITNFFFCILIFLNENSKVEKVKSKKQIHQSNCDSVQKRPFYVLWDSLSRS